VPLRNSPSRSAASPCRSSPTPEGKAPFSESGLEQQVQGIFNSVNGGEFYAISSKFMLDSV
jgi:hypothetical protein